MLCVTMLYYAVENIFLKDIQNQSLRLLSLCPSHFMFLAKGCKINDHSKKIGPHVRTCVALPGVCRYHKVTGSRVQLTVRVSGVLVCIWSHGGGRTILSKS